MLRDTSGFSIGDSCIPDCIQEGRLTVVNMPHDRNYRGSWFQAVLVIDPFHYTGFQSTGRRVVKLEFIVVIFFLIVFVIAITRQSFAKSSNDSHTSDWIQSLCHGRHDTKICHEIFDDSHGLFIQCFRQFTNRQCSTRE
jgi:hypothetical protein